MVHKARLISDEYYPFKTLNEINFFEGAKAQAVPLTSPLAPASALMFAVTCTCAAFGLFSRFRFTCHFKD